MHEICSVVKSDFSHVNLDNFIGNSTIMQISLSGWLDP